MPGRRRRIAQPRATTRAKPSRPPGLAQADDEKLFGTGFVPAMIALEEAGELVYHADRAGRGRDRWYPRPGGYPAQDVSLRALAGSRVALLNAAQSYRVMEEIEATSALYRAHPGAIYLHQGESFLVREIDLGAGHAILEPVQVNYYTQPREINDVRILRSLAHKRLQEEE